MDIKKKIKAACIHCGKTQVDIAASIGCSKQSLYQKIGRDSLTPSDLEQIAEAMGAELVFVFRFPDGTEI